MKFVSLMLKKARAVSLETEESVRVVQTLSPVDPGPVDSCPACGMGIEFEDILLARCESGHYWSEHSSSSRPSTNMKWIFRSMLGNIVYFINP
jgi:hypothetical protein